MWDMFNAAVAYLGNMAKDPMAAVGDMAKDKMTSIGDMAQNPLTALGNEVMKDPMLSASKGLYDHITKPQDASANPSPNSLPLTPPPPNPYATLLSAASQPTAVQQPQMQPARRMQMQPMSYGAPVQNLGMSQMPTNLSLARQAYGRYF